MQTNLIHSRLLVWFAVAFGFDLQNAKPVLLVEERAPFDQPGQAFRKSCWLLLQSEDILSGLRTGGK